MQPVHTSLPAGWQQVQQLRSGMQPVRGNFPLTGSSSSWQPGPRCGSARNSSGTMLAPRRCGRPQFRGRALQLSDYAARSPLWHTVCLLLRMFLAARCLQLLLAAPPQPQVQPGPAAACSCSPVPAVHVLHVVLDVLHVLARCLLLLAAPLSGLQRRLALQPQVRVAVLPPGPAGPSKRVPLLHRDPRLCQCGLAPTPQGLSGPDCSPPGRLGQTFSHRCRGRSMRRQSRR